MSAPLEFGVGVPTEVRIIPATPEVTVEPATSELLVIPVAGPRGERGPMGPAGDDSVAVQELIDAAVNTHVSAPQPHPAYDDMLDLTLIFEAGLSNDAIDQCQQPGRPGCHPRPTMLQLAFIDPRQGEQVEVRHTQRDVLTVGVGQVGAGSRSATRSPRGRGVGLHQGRQPGHPNQAAVSRPAHDAG